MASSIRTEVEGRLSRKSKSPQHLYMKISAMSLEIWINDRIGQYALSGRVLKSLQLRLRISSRAISNSIAFKALEKHVLERCLPLIQLVYDLRRLALSQDPGLF